MKTLFEETTIGSMRLRNRLVRSATWEGMADGEGRLTPRLAAVYEALAKGGVGLIISGACAIAADATRLPGMAALYDDSFIAAWRELVAMVHANGCPIVMQLSFAGRGGSRWTPAYPTQEELQAVVAAFGAAARRAELAGFDGVQVHAAHGFFLSQFLSRKANGRSDMYGGSPENRTRLLAAIYREIRRRTGDGFSVLAKINGNEAGDEAAGLEASLYASRLLADAGIDAIEVSGGEAELKKYCGNPFGESIFRAAAAAIAEAAAVPVILVGHNRTPAVMAELLNTTGIGYFALSRPLIREPGLVNEWRRDAGRPAACVSCNGCFRADGNTCVLA